VRAKGMPSDTPPARPSSAIQGSPLIGLAPWVVFGIVAKRAHVEFAAIAAFVVALIITAHSLGGGQSLKVLDVGSLMAFAGLAVAGGVANPHEGDFLHDYSRAIAASLLAIIAFGSLLFVPFTEQYARESTPRELWSSPQFRGVNRKLTALWGATFALMAIGHVIAGQVDSRAVDTVLNWIVPIGLVLGMIRYTEMYAARARSDIHGRRARATPERS
jgi:hypothetical protein